MGKKVNPRGLRIGITSEWQSRWFVSKDYAKKLEEDIRIRDFIMERWKSSSISEVGIERSSGVIRLIIKTSRPGVLIGRGGTGIGDISSAIKKKFFAGKKVELKIDIQEIKKFEESASLVAQNVAEQLEKRISFRRVLKSIIDQVMKNKNIKGVKVEISGRLGGAEMSRREWASKGSIPLHTLRADIDFAKAIAQTTYGTIGIKAWLYKGDVFNKSNRA